LKVFVWQEREGICWTRGRASALSCA